MMVECPECEGCGEILGFDGQSVAAMRCPSCRGDGEVDADEIAADTLAEYAIEEARLSRADG